MHEEALLRDLRRKVDELSRSHGGARVVRARVALGALSHLDEPRLRELWARAMAGGPADGATLEVDPPGRVDEPGAASIVLRSVTFSDGGTPDAAGAPGPRPPPSSPSRG